MRASVVLDDEPQQSADAEWPQLGECNPVLGLTEPGAIEALMRWLQARPARSPTYAPAT